MFDQTINFVPPITLNNFGNRDEGLHYYVKKSTANVRPE